VTHLQYVNPTSHKRNRAFLVDEIHLLPNFKIAGCDGVERVADVKRRLLEMDRKHVALGDGDGAGRIKAVPYTDGILYVLSGGFEDLVRDGSLRRAPLHRPEKDKPHADGQYGKDSGKSEENEFWHL